MKSTLQSELTNIVYRIPSSTWLQLYKLTKLRTERAGMITNKGRVIRLTRGSKHGVNMPPSQRTDCLRFHTHVTNGKYVKYASEVDVLGLLLQYPQQGQRIKELVFSRKGVTIILRRKGLDRRKFLSYKFHALASNQPEKFADILYDSVEWGGLSWKTLFDAKGISP